MIHTAKWGGEQDFIYELLLAFIQINFLGSEHLSDFLCLEKGVQIPHPAHGTVCLHVARGLTGNLNRPYN